MHALPCLESLPQLGYCQIVPEPISNIAMFLTCDKVAQLLVRYTHADEEIGASV